MPRRKTVDTFRMSDGCAGRSPSSTTRSACLPGVIVPTRLAMPRIFAPLAVMICTASSTVNPASTIHPLVRHPASETVDVEPHRLVHVANPEEWHRLLHVRLGLGRGHSGE